MNQDITSIVVSFSTISMHTSLYRVSKSWYKAVKHFVRYIYSPKFEYKVLSDCIQVPVSSYGCTYIFDPWKLEIMRMPYNSIKQIWTIPMLALYDCLFDMRYIVKARDLQLLESYASAKAISYQVRHICDKIGSLENYIKLLKFPLFRARINRYPVQYCLRIESALQFSFFAMLASVEELVLSFIPEVDTQEEEEDYYYDEDEPISGDFFEYDNSFRTNDAVLVCQLLLFKNEPICHRTARFIEWEFPEFCRFLLSSLYPEWKACKAKKVAGTNKYKQRIHFNARTPKRRVKV